MKNNKVLIMGMLLVLGYSQINAIKVIKDDAPIKETVEKNIEVPNKDNPYILYSFTPDVGLQKFFDRSVVLLGVACDSKACLDSNKKPLSTGFDLYLIQWYDSLPKDLAEGKFDNNAKKYMTHLEPIAGATTQKIYITNEGTTKVPQLDKDNKETGLWVALPTGASLFPFSSDDDQFGGSLGKAKLSLGKGKKAASTAFTPIAPPKSGGVKLKGQAAGHGKK